MTGEKIDLYVFRGDNGFTLSNGDKEVTGFSSEAEAAIAGTQLAQSIGVNYTLNYHEPIPETLEHSNQESELER